MAQQDTIGQQSLAFIGCGKICTPIVQRLLYAKFLDTHTLHITTRTAESKLRLSSILRASPTTNLQLHVLETASTIQAANTIVLGCKSSQYREILSTPGVRAALCGKTLISVLGGVTESDLCTALGGEEGEAQCDIVRALPNVAALVGESATLVSGGSASARQTACELFQHVGSVHEVPPEKIEAAAVVTASGPAFFAAVLQSVSLALVAKGFDEDSARMFAAASMRSTAKLAVTGQTPEYIIKQVATVGGSTEKGLRLLEELGVREGFGRAVNATFEAAKKLGAIKPAATVENGASVGVDLSGQAHVIPETMRAVVLKGVRQIEVEYRSVPMIVDDCDMIVKVQLSGLCGSDLHLYRGTEDGGSDLIMGHEFSGTVVKIGKKVHGFQVGDTVVSPFTISCGACFYCENGGVQAQYVRVPSADTTAFKSPPGIAPRNNILMADIFPFYAVRNGFSQLKPPQIRKCIVAVIGCGPVGLCAIAAAGTFHPNHLIAIDAVPSRLQNAASLGAEPKNYSTNEADLFEHVRCVTNGRGVDVVLELVGQKSALQLAYDLVRPGGVISSIGVHSAEFPFTASQVVPLSEAPKWYAKFERMEVQKVIFDAEK
ncbi:alcohol dehydrogenase [Curvularia clavata]|uniref:Alcohol dehydrogenase n=1 Tax=Curvularia clavata TaxID=95742 RepID=A0A9Q9DS65_CURCL|nr:alcohol dehydrogenase [Curvularia clavata]